ncbi:DUF4169 family protein [Falsirhodobacter algicola]|uniref:DUF4169 family protein n=1 Tax=Falsirhodobacter algicola TaxID=2692330 RepID=A0A8J8MSV1_9RHOB|nr:DUF4169 family protein [Falsirhodobacter algicola]QUS35839.1 DUF4169 family protein [Falsirhodobacter algicola]
MGKVVSLRAARKAKDRAERRAEADANAAKFGRTKAERHRQTAEAEKARRDLDGHERS